MNAPKKIWVRELPRKEDGVLLGLSYHTEPEGLENGTEHPYIRADLVNELVEALEGLARYAGNSGDDYLADKARAALAKLEEE